MTKQLVIGFCGAKGSGKDTGYKLLCELYPNLNFQRIAFADPIKKTICDIFGLTVDQLNTIKRVDNIAIVDYNSNIAYGHLTGRDFVRKIGMLMRDYDDQQFNRYVTNMVKTNASTNYVVTDVRFENEIQTVRDLGGYIIRVDRDCCDYDNHITERKIMHPDFVVKNNSSLQSFKIELKNIVDKLIQENI